MDITITVDPVTNARRLRGTLCGNSVDFDVTFP
jgi:hypothetical protein